MSTGYDPTPPHSQGYGGAEQADDTRQAQQQAANDVPVDVNPNAIYARGQAETMVQLGKEFAAGAARRDGILNQLLVPKTG